VVLPITFIRHGRLSVGVVLHPPAASDIEPPQRQLDLPFVAGGPAFDHRPISFADRSRFEQFTKLRQSLAVAPEHQAADVSRSSRCASAGARGSPKRSAPK